MKFYRRSKFYIYDPRSSIFAEVDENTYRFVYNLWYGGKDETDPETLTKVKRELEKLKRETGFLSVKKGEPYFTEVAFPYSKEEIRDRLENNLSHIILEVTQDCNFRCRYCVYSGVYSDERTHRTVQMSDDTALQALLFLKKRSATSRSIRIGFYGGEPLMNFRLIKFVVKRAEELFRDRKIKFTVTTNGSLLKGEIAKFFVRNNFFVFVSIDGPAEIHDRYRVFPDGRGTFKKVVENLKRLKEIHPDYFAKKVGYITVLAPPVKLAEVIEFFNTWELKTEAPHFLTLVDPVGTDFYHKYMTPEDRKTYSTEFEKLARRDLDNLIYSGTPGKFSDFLIHFDDMTKFHNRKWGKIGSVLYISGFCIPGHDRLFITPDGGLYPCEKVHTHFKIGDLKNGFYYEKIYKTIEKILDIRREMGCLNCWLGRLCSMCFAKVIRNETVRKDLIEKECRKNRKKWEKILSHYVELYERNPAVFEKLKVSKGG